MFPWYELVEWSSDTHTHTQAMARTNDEICYLQWPQRVVNLIYCCCCWNDVCTYKYIVITTKTAYNKMFTIYMCMCVCVWFYLVELKWDINAKAFTEPCCVYLCKVQGLLSNKCSLKWIPYKAMYIGFRGKVRAIFISIAFIYKK